MKCVQYFSEVIQQHYVKPSGNTMCKMTENTYYAIFYGT